MKTFSLNKIIAIFALLFLIGGGKILARNGQPQTLPITNYSPNGSKFYSDFTIDWTTQKLQIIVDVTNCTTDASGNNPDDIFIFVRRLHLMLDGNLLHQLYMSIVMVHN